MSLFDGLRKFFPGTPEPAAPPDIANVNVDPNTKRWTKAGKSTVDHPPLEAPPQDGRTQAGRSRAIQYGHDADGNVIIRTPIGNPHVDRAGRPVSSADPGGKVRI